MDVRDVDGGFEFSESFTLEVKVFHRPHKDFTSVCVNGREYINSNSICLSNIVSKAVSRYIDSYLKPSLDRLHNADLLSRKDRGV